MAQAVDLMLLYGTQRCQQFIQDELNDPSTHRIDPVRGCYISRRTLTNEGYARRSFKTNQAIADQAAGIPIVGTGFKTVYLHRIAYVAGHGQNIPQGMQSSHLCDQPSCFNPAHVTAESGVDNRDRRFCRGDLRCPWHQYRVVMDLCGHTPACIKEPPTRADFHCCLQPDESASSEIPESQSVLASQAEDAAGVIRSQDFSDLPPDSLEQGEIEPTDEDPNEEGDGDTESSQSSSQAPRSWPRSLSVPMPSSASLERRSRLVQVRISAPVSSSPPEATPRAGRSPPKRRRESSSPVDSGSLYASRSVLAPSTSAGSSDPGSPPKRARQSAAGPSQSQYQPPSQSEATTATTESEPPTESEAPEESEAQEESQAPEESGESQYSTYSYEEQPSQSSYQPSSDDPE